MSMEKQEQGGPPKNDDRGGYEPVLAGMQSGEGGVNQYGLRLLTAPIFLWSFRVPVIKIVRLASLTNSSRLHAFSQNSELRHGCSLTSDHSQKADPKKVKSYRVIISQLEKGKTEAWFTSLRQTRGSHVREQAC